MDVFERGAQPGAPRRGALGRPRFGETAFRHLFVPVLLVGALLPWMRTSTGAGWRLTSTTSPAATGPALLVTMLFVWLAEQVYPRELEWNARLLGRDNVGWRRLGRDAFYLFGVTWLSSVLISVLDPRLHVLMRTLRFGLEPLWPMHLPFVARVAGAFLLAELCSYWLHRAAHRFAPLWRFHATHHLITELNGLKAVRTHPVDNALFYGVRVAALLWLGAGTDEVLAALYLGGVLGIVAHANLDLSDRGFGLLLNLPRAHSVHHSADVAEADANFGCHTVLWDRVFRTYRPAPAPGMVLGVANTGARTLWQELVWPLYRPALFVAETGSRPSKVRAP